ncbi:hypothetical protein NEHOM01_2164 [Nematocida homosporus]|uniref:uncharacterized protein n=1 Tax=Nematocida homosporus TaxID=1912981 RepID=UPI002220D8EB|nr:uncharacterized protein NEHOM01_2164 [Nematocida homosporus]KAI5187422.1 hypothetical protein NEHOM01_2164 [Nematocida homosporus]
MSESCGCSSDQNPCQDLLIAAYQCYLKNKKHPEVCLQQVRQAQECYTQSSPTFFTRIRNLFRRFPRPTL